MKRNRGSFDHKQRVIGMFVLVLALWFRLATADTARGFHDVTAPLLISQDVIDAVSAWNIAALPQVSFKSGFGLPNPVAGSYLWLLVTSFGNNTVVASTVSSLLSVIAVGMCINLGTRWFTPRVGLIAGLFMATSVWSIHISQTAWMQGQLEFWSVFAFWLLSIGRVGGAWFIAVLASQTYLAAFGGGVQLFFAMHVLGTRRTTLFSGLLALLIAMAAYVLLVVVNVPEPMQLIGETLKGRHVGMGTTGYRVAIAGVEFNPISLNQTLAMTSGRYFGPDFMVESVLINARRLILEVCLGAGIAVSLYRVLRGNGMRARYLSILLLFLLPPVGGMLISVVSSTFRFEPQYMLLTAPASYLLTALAVAAAIATRFGVVNKILVCILLFTAIAPAVLALWTYRSTLMLHPYAQGDSTKLIEFAPMAVQQNYYAALRDKNCNVLLNPQTELWSAQLMGGRKFVRIAAAEAMDQHDVWTIPSQGGACLLRSSLEPAPLWAEDTIVFAHADADVHLFRSRPIDEQIARQVATPLNSPLALGFGWRLIGFDAPASISVTQGFTLTHVWRIDNVPPEPHETWHFRLHAYLMTQDGKRIDIASGAPLPRGELWRSDDWVISNLRFSAPLDAGEYTIVTSLYDQARAENAAYLLPGGEIAVERKTRLTVLLP